MTLPIEFLRKFTDQDLVEELTRRERIRKEAEESERRKREVTVYCMACNGSGKVRSYVDVMRIAAGEADEYQCCSSCEGTGVVKALLVEKQA